MLTREQAVAASDALIEGAAARAQAQAVARFIRRTGTEPPAGLSMERLDGLADAAERHVLHSRIFWGAIIAIVFAVVVLLYGFAHTRILGLFSPAGLLLLLGLRRWLIRDYLRRHAAGA